ncbi:hypothetical protein HDU81_000860 [Chytriomyces hyalinus]|nr:hypothetical protein HDU81_000860 [Chytriomyces hyalinus]
MPHILGSAYLLGGSADHLRVIYEKEKESEQLDPWEDSPEEIDPDNWRAHLGEKEYLRAYLHFFDDEIVKRGDDWKKTAFAFLTDKYIPDKSLAHENNQLLHGLVEGLGHPLIHLGYALELEDKLLAAEALAMVAATYRKMHSFVDNPNPPEPSMTTTEIREILVKLFEDSNYDDFVHEHGPGHPDKVFDDPSYVQFNTYIIKKTQDKLADAFQKHIEASVMLFMTSHKVGEPEYDFFFVHLVTAAYALRVILPEMQMELPSDQALQQTWHLLRSHMVLMSAVYVSQGRPTIKDWIVEEYNIGERDWKYVHEKALTGHFQYDAHYVKVLRSLEGFENLYGKGDPDDSKYNMYLKAAVKFADDFHGWTGFSGTERHKLDIKETHHNKHEHHNEEHP